MLRPVSYTLLLAQVFLFEPVADAWGDRSLDEFVGGFCVGGSLVALVWSQFC